MRPSLLYYRALTAAALAAALAGCETAGGERTAGLQPVISAEEPSKAEQWMRVATADDRDRIDRLGLAWQSALADARRANVMGEIRREGRRIAILAFGTLLYPALKDFLAFWEEKLEGPLFSVTVAHSKLIKPAELRAVDGVFRLH